MNTICDYCGQVQKEKGAKVCFSCGKETTEGNNDQTTKSNVTLLSADIKESTTFMSDKDVEQARDWVEGYLKKMTVAITSFRGKVIQLTGDGMVASFDSEHHSLQACLAA